MGVVDRENFCEDRRIGLGKLKSRSALTSLISSSDRHHWHPRLLATVNNFSKSGAQRIERLARARQSTNQERISDRSPDYDQLQRSLQHTWALHGVLEALRRSSDSCLHLAMAWSFTVSHWFAWNKEVKGKRTEIVTTKRTNRTHLSSEQRPAVITKLKVAIVDLWFRSAFFADVERDRPENDFNVKSWSSSRRKLAL